MTTITIKIPEDKTSTLSKYVEKMGGEIVVKANSKKAKIISQPEEEEVTHERFFGENIRRVINAFRK